MRSGYLSPAFRYIHHQVHERDLLARVRVWQEETGLTLIVVSHNLDELARLVERVVLLEGGEVAADGLTRQVLSDSQLLPSIGLDLPQSVVLLQVLRKAGWGVRTDRLLPEEAIAEIDRARQVLERSP